MKMDFSSRVPLGELNIIVFDNCMELGRKVDKQLIAARFKNDELLNVGKYSYILPINNTRFANGEGRITLENSVRGKDIYILTDVGNYSCTYKLHGIETHMGPDEHFQDLKRVLCAIGGYARRVSIIMPLLYAGRQHKRIKRESLDCAIALQELERLGVKNIITFDAHDPRVENAVPLVGFTNRQPIYEMLKTLLDVEGDLVIDRSKMMLIATDPEAMDKASCYGNLLNLDIGLYYKVRDYSKTVNGKNLILKREYLGKDVSGKDILILDDMISSGDSILGIIDDLKKRNAGNIYVAVTYALFTESVDRFNSYYKSGLFKKLLSTNLTYVPDSVKQSPWYAEVDMSECISAIINASNYEEAVSPMFDNATEKIKALLENR